MIEHKENNQLTAVLSLMLHKEKNVEFAYLFGSTARMTRRDNSDIDIGIYLRKDLSKKIGFIRKNLLQKLRKRLVNQLMYDC